MGDVMLGRLIDQLFPTHVDEPSEARIVERVRLRTPSLNSYSPKSPWGNTLPLLYSSHLNIANLETSVTTHPIKWPDKVFNYRMHPANISALKAAKIDYVSLANNHSLDFGEEGLVETFNSLEGAGIAFAGAGRSKSEARRPAVLHLPRSSDASTLPPQHPSLQIFSASDHPFAWFDVPTFHHITYTPATLSHLKALSAAYPRPSSSTLRVFSVHWGPNYSWHPSRRIRSFARSLIDELDVDIIHGHSSHHVQGIEWYKDKLIIYGCGDFVDDYAVDSGYRNDLSAIWRVSVDEVEGGAETGAAESQNDKQTRLKLKRLEIFPTRIKSFQANLLEPSDPDHGWVRERITQLTRELGMQDKLGIGTEGQLIYEF